MVSRKNNFCTEHSSEILIISEEDEQIKNVFLSDKMKPLSSL